MIKVFKIIKKLLIIMILLYIVFLLMLNFFIGYNMDWYDGYLHNYIFHIPIYIKEGTWEYKDNDRDLSVSIKNIDDKMEFGNYIDKCYYNNNKSKNLNYDYYAVILSYEERKEGKIGIVGHKVGHGDIAFDFVDDTVFWGDFKYQSNKDIVCTIIDSDNELWGGPKEFTLRKVD